LKPLPPGATAETPVEEVISGEAELADETTIEEGLSADGLSRAVAR
jgi:hypothetical protein